jgi:spermidine synthase
VIALQSEAPLLMRSDFVRIVKTLQGVFPRVHPYFGPVAIYPSGAWSWTFASSTVDPLSPRPERLAQIEPACRQYNRDIHLGAFALPSDLRRLLAR